MFKNIYVKIAINFSLMVTLIHIFFYYNNIIIGYNNSMENVLEKF